MQIRPIGNTLGERCLRLVCDWSQTLCLKPFFEVVFASSRRCVTFASACIRILRKSFGPVGGCDLKLDWFAIGLREVLASASPQGDPCTRLLSCTHFRDGICRYISLCVVSAAVEAVTLFQNERTSCQQCSFHGIASSQSIADPYTQVRKEYETS